MTVTNDLTGLMQSYLQEKEKLTSQNSLLNAGSATKTTKTTASSGVESSEDSEETKRDTFGLSTFELMSDQDYESFLRATEGLDEMTTKRYASSLQYFTVSYQNLMSNSQNLSLATMQEGGSDNSSVFDLLSENMMMKVSSYALDEGAQVLKKVAGNGSKDILNFFSRFQNALASNETIDAES